jgi:hypothetical protein
LNSRFRLPNISLKSFDYCMARQAINGVYARQGRIASMLRSAADRPAKPRVIPFGNREVVTEGLQLSFCADISHR